MDLPDKAIQVLEYLRDLAEDTNNNKEVILIYEAIGKLYQDKKEYNDAILAFKRMLQVAWMENDLHYETKSYEYIALQHFYLQSLSKASVYKMKAFHGDLEGSDSVCKRQAIQSRISWKKRIG
jgi:tetratricopeptide (TPR) repeat protein